MDVCVLVMRGSIKLIDRHGVHQSPYSLSGKTSYRQISSALKPRYWMLWLLYRSKIWHLDSTAGWLQNFEPEYRLVNRGPGLTASIQARIEKWATFRWNGKAKIILVLNPVRTLNPVVCHQYPAADRFEALSE